MSRHTDRIEHLMTDTIGKNKIIAAGSRRIKLPDLDPVDLFIVKTSQDGRAYRKYNDLGSVGAGFGKPCNASKPFIGRTTVTKKNGIAKSRRILPNLNLRWVDITLKIKATAGVGADNAFARSIENSRLTRTRIVGEPNINRVKYDM
ncbi:MAG: hypothetical protein Q8916_11020 [Bacteroidota bacterium]|nr:hypothetical protein [Bacteroidota bacterium]